MFTEKHPLPQGSPTAQIQEKVPKLLEQLLEPAEVHFNGKNPWDIQILDEQVFSRVFSQGSLGFGEAYMDSMWECKAPDQLFDRLLRLDINRELGRWSKIRMLREFIRYRLFNLQSLKRAFQVGERHYDIGDDIFESMLDPTMSYSSAYWKNADNLQEAQQNKLNLICRKLELKAGEKLLDIGCGWGGLAEFAAKNYQVEVDGITVSKKQAEFARRRNQGLPVKIHLLDYRKHEGHYDKIVSVGMFEHVGLRNYRTFFQKVDSLLNDNGLFLLHTIGTNKTSFAADPWIDKYIFPNGKIPSASQINTAIENLFILEDWHNFGRDYDRTLMSWWENFRNSWPRLEKSYSKRFYRMWKYYLMASAGFFRSRQGQLWQIVLSKRKRNKIYRSVR